MLVTTPFLQGSFAPVTEEITAFDLPVTGRIPAGLSGRYLRNGPNPLGLEDPNYHWFIGGAAWCMASGCARAGPSGTATDGSGPSRPRGFLGEQWPTGPIHEGDDFAANTHIIRHAGRTLATVEAGALPYELTDELGTVGPCDFSGTLPGGYAAHTKLDPRTGELHAIAYFWAWDYVQHVVVSSGGQVTKTTNVSLPHRPMMHDLALTEKYVVLFDLPVTFSAAAATSGSPLPYTWNPERQARVGLLPRDGSAAEVRWLEVDPCWVFHTFNAYDDGGRVVVDLIQYQGPYDVSRLSGHGPLTLERWTIDPAGDKVTRRQIDNAGALRQAAVLLDGLDVSLLNDADLAQLDLIRARILFTARGSGETVLLLARAAKRLETVSAELARATYLHAFSAGTILGRDVTIDQWLDLGQAASTVPPTDPPGAGDILLDGLALQLTAGYPQGLAPLRQALAQFTADDRHENSTEVLWLACCVAITVWDDSAWDMLSARFVNEGRRTGALVHLLAAVQMRAIECVLAGDFTEAASRVEEKNVLTSVIGPTHGGDSAAIFLAAWQGHEINSEADTASQPPSETWGFEADVSCYATSVLCNALGRYESAMEAARAFLADANGRWAPALPELVEAAMRCEQPELARLAVDRLAATTAVSRTNWAAGLECLSRALITGDHDAEPLYLESIDHLGRTRILTSFARAKLLYGEWLRRQGRRVDARDQLRAARDMFASMGAQAFAARAGRELAATGERLRKRSASPELLLTPQETQIVRLAMDGQSNIGIAAQLFISPRTVEYHLHKIFAKLGISSRNQLSRALQRSAATQLQGEVRTAGWSIRGH